MQKEGIYHILLRISNQTKAFAPPIHKRLINPCESPRMFIYPTYHGKLKNLASTVLPITSVCI
jgi:hypothetical protein